MVGGRNQRGRQGRHIAPRKRGHIKCPVRFRSDSQDEFPHGPDTLPQQPGLGEEVASTSSLQKLGGKGAAKPFRRIRRGLCITAIRDGAVRAQDHSA